MRKHVEDLLFGHDCINEVQSPKRLGARHVTNNSPKEKNIHIMHGFGKFTFYVLYIYCIYYMNILLYIYILFEEGSPWGRWATLAAAGRPR